MEILSSKEFEVLNYLVMGWSNKKIAEILCVTTDTVKAHITSILRKFNVSNRTEAAYFAFKHGIILL